MVLRGKKLTAVLFPKGYLKYVRFAGHLLVPNIFIHIISFIPQNSGKNKLVAHFIDGTKASMG